MRIMLPLAGIAISILVVSRPATAAGRPNIVIIMLDDLGYSDLGCYGGEIKTPHIDRLANRGLRFTRFYNCARCCPTRASLLTGLYQHQVGLERNGKSLSRYGVTIAEVLKTAGYQTAMSGKWHLSETYRLKNPLRHQKWIDHQISRQNQPFGPRNSYPAQRGFDKFYGIIWGVVNYFDPFSLVEGMTPVKNVPKDYYITDAITKHAVQSIREAEKNKPLFLYVAHCAPHWPLHARKEDIAKYDGMFSDGWHAMHARRYKRQIAMGLIDPKTHPLPKLMGGGDDWQQLSKADRAIQTAKMRVHAAMIDRVDQGVGHVIEALKDTGRYENTVIIVLADNGASPEVPKRPGYDRSGETRGGKPIRYRGFSPAELGTETTYTGIGSWWANAAKTPFRYWKMESYEGGMHTPLIVHWPAGLKSKPGSTTQQMGHVIDIMPTCLELADAKYPTKYRGRAIKSVEGKSLMPILRGKKRKGHNALFFEHAGGKAVIADGFKIVQPTRSKTWQLFNLKTDRTETTDLAPADASRVKKLIARWNAWAERVGVQNRK